jgi:hypothetical protein
MAIPKQFTRENLTRERWERGRLSYKFHDGQRKIEAAFAAKKTQLFVGELSRQFGKTFWLVTKALEKAFQKKNAKAKIGTAFQTDLLEFILPTFDVVMEDCPDDLRPVWKSQQAKFIVPSTKSEIKLIGLDRKPNGMRGNLLDFIGLDEAGFMSRLDYLYKSVIIPATTHRPDCDIVVLSTPPDTPAHEFLDYVQKAEMEGGYLKLTIRDNPMVDEATIKRLILESGGEHSTTWRREYLVEHVTDANLAIISDWKDEYVQAIPRDEYYGFYHKYVQMDLGVSDHTAAVFSYYDFLKGQFIIEDEFVISGPQMNTNILQAHLKHRELKNWGENYKVTVQDNEKISDCEIDAVNEAWKQNTPKVFVRLSDNNNPLLLQDLSLLHGIHFIPTDKGRLSEMVNAVKIMVRAGEIIVHPDCLQTKGCLKYGVWDKNRQKFAHSKVYGHFDALAAVIYGIRNLNKFDNPIPQDYGADRNNQVVFPYVNGSQSVKALKNAFRL